MPGKQRYAWMDGRLVNFENANVSFVNAGLHYGISVFEGIRCYATDRGPAIFRLAEHAARLFDSAHILGFRQLPFSLDDLVEAIKKTVAANGFGDCYVRPLVY